MLITLSTLDCGYRMSVGAAVLQVRHAQPRRCSTYDAVVAWGVTMAGLML